METFRLVNGDSSGPTKKDSNSVLAGSRLKLFVFSGDIYPSSELL
jgi:hypothetical protein